MSNQDLIAELQLMTQSNASKTQPQIKRTNDEIQRAKRNTQADRSEKKKILKSFIDDGSKNPYKGQPLADILAAWKDDPDQVKTVLNRMEEYIRPKNVSSSQMGITYEERQRNDREWLQVMNEVASEKVGFLLTSGNIQKICEKFGITDSGVRKKLRELILLDDWEVIVPMAAAALEEYGPPAISYLWDRFVRPYLARTFPGHDEGLTLDDYSSNNIQDPNKISLIPNVNVFSEKLKDLSGSDQLLKDAVNKDYLSCLLCPERFTYRRPLTYPKRTALVSAGTQFILTSDDNGNTAFWVSPWNGNLPAANNTPQAFFAAFNPTGFVPNTGEWTDASYTNGPLNPALFNRWTLTAMSVTITPISSPDNTAGQIQLSYFPEIGLGTATQPVFAQAGLSQTGFYQSGNALNTYRSIWLPTSYGTTLYANEVQPGHQDLFYGLITGAAENTNVAKVDVYFVYEVIPTLAQLQYSVSDFATPGVRTDDAITTLTYASPGMQMLTLDDAFDLALCFKTAHPTYDGVLICALEKMLNWRKHPNTSGPTFVSVQDNRTQAKPQPIPQIMPTVQHNYQPPLIATHPSQYRVPTYGRTRISI
jgi:hypothetical protein